MSKKSDVARSPSGKTINIWWTATSGKLGIWNLHIL
jgi:hypothetical protein